jgi:type IV secretory pathway TrbF-like protein/sugar phosphate permease
MLRCGQTLAQDWQLIAFVFLPFSVGFYLSYLFRTINALISVPLSGDFALGAADLGLLTSVYFLTFAAAQIPIGIWLDRYGPRRVQSVLLLVAAVGAGLFAVVNSFAMLVVARAMIGLGVAAALTAGIKAIVLWFPNERVALINGYMVMFGSLGAVTATAPVEMLLGLTGWRGLFGLLAAMTAATAALIYLVVPEPPISASRSTASLKLVLTDRRFWRLMPLSATCVGSAWSLQSLWAASWLTDVEGFDRAGVVTNLLVMALALSAGALLLGTVADRMRCRGIGPDVLLKIVVGVFIAVQLALVLRMPLPSYLVWSVVGAAGAATVLSYAVLADYYPKELVGRANGTLNAFQFGGAFLLQYMTGLVLEQWMHQDGRYPIVAYQVAFGLILTLLIVALVWFEAADVFGRAIRTLRVIGARSNVCELRDPVTPYGRAMREWVDRFSVANAERSHWRLSAFGSISLSVLLGVVLAVGGIRTNIAPYMISVDRVNMAPANPVIEPHAPSDAQIAFFLARFIRNVRSLSTDPIVVRANWREALEFATGRGAQALDAYARSSTPFTRIGTQAVLVEVINVVRASSESFEIIWQEHSYRSGSLQKVQRFAGIVEVVFNVSRIHEMSNNPLGLYIHDLRWSTVSTR